MTTSQALTTNGRKLDELLTSQMSSQMNSRLNRQPILDAVSESCCLYFGLILA